MSLTHCWIADDDFLSVQMERVGFAVDGKFDFWHGRIVESYVDQSVPVFGKP